MSFSDYKVADMSLAEVTKSLKLLNRNAGSWQLLKNTVPSTEPQDHGSPT